MQCEQCESKENVRMVGEAAVCDICYQKSVDIIDAPEPEFDDSDYSGYDQISQG